MKKVFETMDKVCHTWAHQLQEEGRNGLGSISFSNRWLYSYNTPIAYYVNPDVVVTTTTSFSPTTNKHQNAVWHATSHMENIRLPIPLTSPFLHTSAEQVPFSVERLLNLYIRDLHKVQARLARWKKGRNLLQAEADLRSFNLRIATTLQLLYRYFPDVFGHRWSLPTEKKLALWSELGRLRKIDPNYKENLRLAAIAEAERLEKEASKKRVRAKALPFKQHERLIDWKRGDNNQWVYGVGLPNDCTYLRPRPAFGRIVEHIMMGLFGNDKDGLLRIPIVETSKGITFTYPEFVKALAGFKRGKLKGLTFGGFSITQVDHEAQTVTAGCHTVPLSEIAYFAKIYDKLRKRYKRTKHTDEA